MMRIVSWNIAHRSAAWDVLTSLGADLALLQEAVPPADGDLAARCAPPADTDWRIDLRGVKPFGTAVACLNAGMTMEPVPALPLAAARNGDLEASHPGQFTVARVPWNGGQLTVVSLYGIWDRQDGVGIFSEATLHRALSDLTPLLQRREPLLIAGDLNVFHGYTLDGEKYWRPRYDTVFQRLAAYGLDLVGPFSETGPLEGCRCGPAPACRHVRTFRFQNKPDSRPDQLDFVFANQAARDGIETVRALDDPACWAASDHTPIVIDLA